MLLKQKKRAEAVKKMAATTEQPMTIPIIIPLVLSSSEGMGSYESSPEGVGGVGSSESDSSGPPPGRQMGKNTPKSLLQSVILDANKK